MVEILSPYLNLSELNRRLPITAEQIVCASLEIMAGGHFFRVAGYSSGVAKSSAHNIFYRYINNPLNHCWGTLFTSCWYILIK